MTIEYPPARLGTDSVDLHGRSLPDPYRWLETDSAETRTWVEAQAGLAASALAELPARDEIRARLTELGDYPKKTAPWKSGGRWFQWRNSGLQNQLVLYVMTSPTDEGRVLLDANTMAVDGTKSVVGTAVTRDGGTLAYGVSTAGSDWRTWYLLDIESGRALPDVIEWSKLMDVSWLPDGSGFYYCGYAAPIAGEELIGATSDMRVLLHRLGTSQDTDELVYERPGEKGLLIAPAVTEDGGYLMVVVIQGAESANELHLLDLATQEWTAVVPDHEHQWLLLGVDAGTLYLQTNAGAPRNRVVSLPLGRPVSEAVTVVAESEHKLVQARLVGGRFVLEHLVHATSRLSVAALDGEPLHEIGIPAFSTVPEIKGDADEPLLHLSTTGFTDSGTVWSHDVSTGVTTMVSPPLAPVDFAAMVVEQVFVTSADGTQVPAFLVHREDVTPTGDVPVWQYAYGGFNIPIGPAFSIQRAVWVERGGMFVLANLRGGGEYGVDWWDAGRLANKQNVFDDFYAVTQWLQTSGWSSKEHIAVNGGSNGGLLVGASLVQHPEAFGAVVCEVGVLDMIRFPLFTVGWAWTSDYGDPQDETAFTWLAKISPLHNVRNGTEYPPTLVMTGDHDDRVVPSHSYKFAAALQAAQSGDADLLLRVELATGHGAGKPLAKVIDERTDMLAFMEHHVGARAGQQLESAS